jgi:putative cardiolipin synthase
VIPVRFQGRTRPAGSTARAGVLGRAVLAAGRWLPGVMLAALAACSSLPPGADYPRVASRAFSDPGQTRLGQAVAGAVAAHAPDSGFRLISVGQDGFALRMQLIRAAQSSLDLQYFIFRGDNTGSLLTAAILDSADRGVRVRILVDDAETVAGDDRILALVAHPLIQVRIFNPFRYRGHIDILRGIEYGLDFRRLDYRMHNKLLVADGAIAVIGGRNLSDPYFQVNPESQFADDDVAAAGPVVPRLSGVFDEFWNSALSIPSDALSGGRPTTDGLGPYRAELDADRADWKRQGADYLAKVAGGEPLASLLDGRLPLVWAGVTVIYDSPDKRKVDDGEMVGRLMHRAVARAAENVQSELLMVTPYLIPGREGMRIFADLRTRKVRVRILTTSLEANTVVLAQAGYMRYRRPLLEQGVELYEIRALLGSARGSGESAAMARHGNYSLHAKMFVFDRKRIFIGSMNFDQRSMHLNTEIGLLIDSTELAGQIAARFDAMVRLENAYTVVLQPDPGGRAQHMVWRTQENGAPVDYELEPERQWGQRLGATILSWLPIDDEL